MLLFEVSAEKGGQFYAGLLRFWNAGRILPDVPHPVPYIQLDIHTVIARLASKPDRIT